MIFVTVGTHEQSFNRLIEEIDRLKGENLIEDEIIIQKGYSTYIPKYCTSFDLIPYEEMQKYQEDARIIITHGGPASFIYPLSIGKIPVVVPRQKVFDEHINDHQLEFCEQVKERGFSIILVKEIKDLLEAINNYGNCTINYESNNEKFVNELIKHTKELFINAES
ncbi:MAG: multidrug MFS transporter [Erysipelotrichaceae bacterium]|nr:multidrug MFS transporter [Erysipelotrichaceae bacterium]